MDIIADDIIDKEELKKAPPVDSLQVVKQIPDKEETLQHLSAMIRNLNEHRIHTREEGK